MNFGARVFAILKRPEAEVNYKAVCKGIYELGHIPYMVILDKRHPLFIETNNNNPDTEMNLEAVFITFYNFEKVLA